MRGLLYLIGFVLILGALRAILIGATALVASIFLCAVFLLFVYYFCAAIRSIYFLFNPAAKARHLHEVEQNKREQATRAAEVEEKEKAKKEAEEKAKAEAEEKARLDTMARLEEISRLNALALEKRYAENFKRISLRDADIQDVPYEYQVGRHANEALAYRYGLANETTENREYTYYGKGGVKIRNPDRDTVHFKPANTIRLRKVSKIKKDVYEVELPDYKNRKAKAVIEVGTEYVKTFLPLNEKWHKVHDEFELVMKGNKAFSLKELASFHIIKTVRSNDN